MNHCPLINSVDLLIVGASSAAVAAALSARQAGASVAVVSPLNYMGEDITAYLRYELADGETAGPAIAQDIYNGLKRPAAVKHCLEQALVQADIEVIFGSSPIAVLENSAGEINGVVIANRCGRQAIAAKRIIDATEFALCARVAAVPMHEWNGGTVEAIFRVVSDEALHDNAEILAKQFPIPVKKGEDQLTNILEYRSNQTLKDNSVQSWCSLQKNVQSKYWQHNSSVFSERAYCLPQDSIISALHVDEWTGAEDFSLFALRTADKALSVLGPCADVSRAVAEQLYRPAHAMIIADKLGTALAKEVAGLDSPSEFQLRAHGAVHDQQADVRMYSNGFEPNAQQYQQISIEHESMPRLGHYQNLVVGGGTGGASAAIAAARQGTQTMLVEFQHALGGVGTLGMIAVYYYGNICGFTSEMDEEVSQMGDEVPFEGRTNRWIPHWKQAWYLEQLMDDHVDVAFQSVAYGVLRNENTVQGVLVATPYGCGLIEADSIIDSTGAADIAAAAGAPCRSINNDHVAVQGTGLSPMYVGTHYSNTDHNFIDDNNQRDVTAAMISAKEKFPDAFDISQLVNSRERRQIYGEYELSPIDFFRDHTFDDSICFASSNFDSHGYTVHPVFAMKAPDHERMWVHVPYRALLPQGLDNVLVTGLGVSAQRDVLPVIRMQPDVQNQGYAAGYAASLAQKDSCNLRDVSVRKIQEHLVEKGNLDAAVLTHEDTPAPSEAEIKAAIADGWDEYKGLSIIFACAEAALPSLKEAYAASKDNAQRLAYAKIAALLGDNFAAETLYGAIENESWDEGWNYKGMGQFGMSTSVYDSIWHAIGASQAQGSLAILAKRIKELDGDAYFSHCKAIAAACAGIGQFDEQKELAEAIHALLSTDGMSGHYHLNIHDVHAALTDNPNENDVRNKSLRELVLARALFYCGDHLGLGEKILSHYANDMRGIFARHAVAVLAQAAPAELLV